MPLVHPVQVRSTHLKAGRAEARPAIRVQRRARRHASVARTSASGRTYTFSPLLLLIETSPVSTSTPSRYRTAFPDASVHACARIVSSPDTGSPSGWFR